MALSAGVPVELGGKQQARPETDEPDPGDDAHRDPVRAVPRGHDGDQDRPGDGGGDDEAQLDTLRERPKISPWRSSGKLDCTTSRTGSA